MTVNYGVGRHVKIISAVVSKFETGNPRLIAVAVYLGGVYFPDIKRLFTRDYFEHYPALIRAGNFKFAESFFLSELAGNSIYRPKQGLSFGYPANRLVTFLE